MSIMRRFLIASSMARLIMRDRSAVRVVEGHFPASHERLSHVLFEGSICHLVLVTKPGTEWEEEERTEVPLKQGEFLMEVCAGSLAYQRSSIEVGGQPARIESFRVPERLNLVEVEFDDPDHARTFAPPVWFGPEVTGEAAYDRNSIATAGQPDHPEITVSDAAVHAVLDVLDGPDPGQATGEQPEPESQDEPQSARSEDAEDGSGVVEPFPQRAHAELLSVISQRHDQLSAVERN